MDGLDPTEGMYEQNQVDDKVVEILEKSAEDARHSIDRISELRWQRSEAGLSKSEWSDARAALTERWRQIGDATEKACQMLIIADSLEADKSRVE